MEHRHKELRHSGIEAYRKQETVGIDIMNTDTVEYMHKELRYSRI